MNDPNPNRSARSFVYIIALTALLAAFLGYISWKGCGTRADAQSVEVTVPVVTVPATQPAGTDDTAMPTIPPVQQTVKFEGDGWTPANVTAMIISIMAAAVSLYVAKLTIQAHFERKSMKERLDRQAQEQNEDRRRRVFSPRHDDDPPPAGT